MSAKGAVNEEARFAYGFETGLVSEFECRVLTTQWKFNIKEIVH